MIGFVFLSYKSITKKENSKVNSIGEVHKKRPKSNAINQMNKKNCHIQVLIQEFFKENGELNIVL